MIKVIVCIGSSCHLKGSRTVIEQLQYFINRDNIGDKVELNGAFCMGKCAEKGVSVTVDDKFFAVNSDKVKDFYEKEIKAKL